MPSESLSVEELQSLQRLQSIVELSRHEGWKLLRAEVLESLAMLALEDMKGASYGTAEVRSSLMSRWQQRQIVLEKADQYIADAIEERQRILDDIETRNKLRSMEEVPTFRGMSEEAYDEQFGTYPNPN